ncbi:Mce-associated membrane protein [Actinokineospora alba]|uniref:Mce-associated membrane protein n=1 Tax=Actinokineospora alba TaxID=504798 RepID=A0A1H0NIF8_9PSEU|nr:Mce-associated membrane protein [Actinokineospora alba]SDH85421.1 Mce-associated membrane protein [Actinokineospora alba]SDO92449.1 Mce-associated membrane protein [Actinokineospora alba]
MQAVAAVALILASWFAIEDIRLRENANAGNRALVDSASTGEVTAQVSQAVRSVFSYDYNRLEQSRAVALQVLSGRAVEQYEQVMGRVAEQAATSKLVVSTSVRSIGLTDLRPDSARALLFIDAQSIRTTDNHRTSTSAGLFVTARRVDGRWKIIDLTPA